MYGFSACSPRPRPPMQGWLLEPSPPSPSLPPIPTQTILQLGVGGGVKAGCNVWRALRNIEGDRAMHTTWRHLGGKGITGEHSLFRFLPLVLAPFKFPPQQC